MSPCWGSLAQDVEVSLPLSSALLHPSLQARVLCINKYACTKHCRELPFTKAQIGQFLAEAKNKLGAIGRPRISRCRLHQEEHSEGQIEQGTEKKHLAARGCS